MFSCSMCFELALILQYINYLVYRGFFFFGVGGGGRRPYYGIHQGILQGVCSAVWFPDVGSAQV